VNCEDLRDLFSPYLDGQLTAAEADRLAAHVRTCPSCQEQLAALRFTSGLVSALPQAPLPADLAPRVVARVSPSPWRERLAAVREFLTPRRAFLVRAVAVLAVFCIAAAAPRSRVGEIVISWPIRVAGAAEIGIGYLAAGIVQARTLLSGAGQVQFASREPARSPGKHRAPALRQSGGPSDGALV
jgi:anti-sigma factor RsiW